MTPSEVVALMEEILKVDDVAPDDSFFEVGGNSLLAVQLITAVERRSGAVLSLSSVIRSPTPEGISQLITSSIEAS